MSIQSFFENIFGDTDLPSAAAVAAAPDTAIAAVKGFGESEATKVITALRQTDIGAAVAADISTVEGNSEMNPTEKFDQVVANTLPLVQKFVSEGGVPAAETDLLSITKGLVQMVYLDTASTSFGQLAAPMLKLLGV